MSEKNSCQSLISELNKHQQISKEIFVLLKKMYANEIAQLGKTQSTSLMVAGVLENYYTCVETLFLRISQFFENKLDPEKWHRSLLDKMTLSIKDIRIPVISDKTHDELEHLLRFRHFKRYYYQLDYDWEQLDLLVGKLKKLHPILQKNLNDFSSWLDSIEG